MDKYTGIVLDGPRAGEAMASPYPFIHFALLERMPVDAVAPTSLKQMTLKYTEVFGLGWWISEDASGQLKDGEVTYRDYILESVMSAIRKTRR